MIMESVRLIAVAILCVAGIYQGIGFIEKLGYRLICEIKKNGTDSMNKSYLSNDATQSYDFYKSILFVVGKMLSGIILLICFVYVLWSVYAFPIFVGIIMKLFWWVMKILEIFLAEPQKM